MSTTINEKIANELKDAMRAKDQTAMTALRALKSALKYGAVEKLGADGVLDDTDALAARIERFRAHASKPPEPCASCTWRASCRGGCRVVAEALTRDVHAPDPECPRVRAMFAL